MDLHDRCEMAIKIIQATEDGSLLTPQELYLTQEAVNGHLNDKGYEFFKNLHASIENETFVPFNKRYFHGIENITADPNGAGGGLWIRWKGHDIEHYDQPWAWSEEGKKEALTLSYRCKHLESLGVPINSGTVIWNWEKYSVL